MRSAAVAANDAANATKTVGVSATPRSSGRAHFDAIAAHLDADLVVLAVVGWIGGLVGDQVETRSSPAVARRRSVTTALDAPDVPVPSSESVAGTVES
jgi:hypothetical protein